jgi:hypothetical protein
VLFRPSSRQADDLVVETEKTLHCKKKVSDFPVPSQDVTNQTLPGKFFMTRESLVGDTPAGAGKVAHLFLQCISKSII